MRNAKNLYLIVLNKIIDFQHSYLTYFFCVWQDNIIVTGASANQDDIWEDIDDPAAEDVDWASLCKKWHVTLW